ncbi:hypothetical protein Lalb_Chr16g0389781 [Lupinus albus]|uniref:Uncharacterized protein n=1 Tax=Lupinus albus TaxID=3870 RepID=A0A6A4PDN9_LUPAL|nr:hypothetical protein Lalb_Chr16g0389781 [Lupinus albus]
MASTDSFEDGECPLLLLPSSSNRFSRLQPLPVTTIPCVKGLNQDLSMMRDN